MFKRLVWIILISVLLAGIVFFVYEFGLKSQKTLPIYQPQTTSSQKVCPPVSKVEYTYYEQTDPLWQKNNKFGLYVYAEEANLIEAARKLVNSNGGEWGYVMIPFNVKDRDSTKWSRVFEQLRNKKLIPIIQLWDVDLNKYQKQTKDSAEFLNTFVWPIKYRYITVYNEPNDSKFWYGNVNPEEYAKVLDYTINAYKKVNPDYFMISGAFNASAPNDKNNMDEFTFMWKMHQKYPGIFNKLDGWASHPYPQPNFSGSPNDTGRWSIRAYEDELEYLKNYLGVTKVLPVFITETGWAHAEGSDYNASYLPVETVANYFKIAYEQVWLKDDRVRAVTPFTVRYDPPFDHFSWINSDGVGYKHYEVVKSMSKVKGEPPALKSKFIEVGGCE